VSFDGSAIAPLLLPSTNNFSTSISRGDRFSHKKLKLKHVRYFLKFMKFAQTLLKSSLGFLVPTLIVLGSIRAIAIPSAPAKVPGTAVSITPPAGFKASKLFTGFEQTESGASMMVTEIPIPKNEQQKAIAKLSSAATLKTKGISLISSQDMTVDGHRGKLLLVSQEFRGIPFLKWMVVLAKGDRALMVVAPFPESLSQKLREPLRQSILTLKWTPGIQTSRLEGLPFSFQEQGDLKVSERMSNMVLLTKNGVMPPIPASKPILIVGVAYQEAQILDIAQFTQKHLKQVSNQVRDLTEVSRKHKTIAGQKAFEIVAQGYDVRNKTPLTVYEVIIATNKTYYIVQGFVPKTNAAKYLPIFRAIAESVRPKI
jgi:hypothetical protein